MDPISITTLPDEILLAICTKLCRHCCNIPRDQPKQPWEKRFGPPLSCLSKTCQRLRDIAQPVLHHDACPGDVLKFLRTIMARPDLAAQVRRFCNDGAKLSDLDSEVSSYIDEGYDDTEMMERMLDERIYGHHQLLEMALALLPNTEALVIMLPLQEGYRLENSLPISAIIELVSSLLLIPWSEVDLGQMSAFLTMMPCLERLEVEHCGTVTQILPLVRLRSLKVKDSAMGTKSLQNLVDSCPKLERFEYNFQKLHGQEVDDEPFTWGQAQRILHSRRKTLKHLKLDFGRDLHFREQPLQQGEYLSSFREFDALESLWVLTTSFGSEDDLATIPTFPESVQHLVDMLPESLICVGFCGKHLKWDGLRVLAQAIREGHFPRLRRVMLELEPVGRFRSGHHQACISIGLEDYQELFTLLGVYFQILDTWEVDAKWKQYTTAQYA